MTRAIGTAHIASTPCDREGRDSASEHRRRRSAALPGRGIGRDVAAGAAGLTVAGLTLLSLLTVARRGTGTADAPARPDDVLLLVLLWVGIVLAGWLALGCLFAVTSLLPGTAGRAAGEIAERVTPAAARKVLTLLLGAAVGSMALPPAPVSGAGSRATARAAGGEASSHERDAAVGLAPGYVPTPTPGYGPGAGSTGSAASAGSARSAGSAGSAGPLGSTDRPGSAPGAALSDLPALPELPGLPEVGAGPGYSPTPPVRQQGAEAPASQRLLDGPGYLPTPPVPVLDADRSRLLAPAPRPATSANDLVTVRRGDSLWTIAARHLGPGASDATIAHEWPRWYAANRDLVGDDPDLLVPGVQLRPPPSTSPAATGGQRAASAHSSSAHVTPDSGATAEHRAHS